MRTTPENKIKVKVVALLDFYGCFHYPASASPYGIAGIPDRIGCFHRLFFGVEVKRPGGKPTALQKRCGQKIEAAGGKWFLVDGDEALEQLRSWLEEVRHEREES